MASEKGIFQPGIFYNEIERKHNKYDTVPDRMPNIRLLCGFSYSGVFNRLVLIKDRKELRAVFGDYDRTLEKRGCWFVRMIDICLSYGPVLALNLHAYKNLNKEYTAVAGMDGSVEHSVSLNNIYDTNTFYTPSPDKFRYYVANNRNEYKDDIYIVNTSSNDYSYFITKADYDQLYDVTIEDFYSGGTDNMPEELVDFINRERINRKENSFEQLHTMNEFLYNVYVFNGNWKEQLNSKAIKFIKDNGGDIVYDDDNNIVSISVDSSDKFFSDLASECSIRLFRHYRGVTIPHTANTDGAIISLESMINSECMNNNMLCCIPDIIYDDSHQQNSAGYSYSENKLTDLIVLKKIGPGIEPDGTNETQNQILNMLRPADKLIVGPDGKTWGKSNMFKQLADKDNVPFRYIVDCFGLGYELNSKSVYSDICDAKGSAAAIVNFPNYPEIKANNRCSDVYGSMVNNIIDGIGLSLPDSHNNYVYYPYITINDIGTKTIDIPPAALVSNMFIKKNGAGKLDMAVAGYQNGVMTNIVKSCLDMSDSARDKVSSINVNPIINTERGVVIFGNRSTLKETDSNLSSIHCNELNIHIYNLIDSITKEYVFEMNNATVRNRMISNIRTKLEMLQKRFPTTLTNFEVRETEEDDTYEYIDNLLEVIEIGLEYAKAYEKIFINLMLYRNENNDIVKGINI